jgi:hypothetical protein
MIIMALGPQAVVRARQQRMSTSLATKSPALVNLTCTSSTVGTITVYTAKNVHIIGSEIDSYAQAAIMLYENLRDCRILGNKIRDARGAGSPGALVAIHLNSVGLFGIYIKDSVLEPSSSSGAPLAFIRADFLR